MSTRSRGIAPTVDPTAWANRLAEAKARAAQLKAARAAGYSSTEISQMYSESTNSNNDNAQVSEPSAPPSSYRPAEQEYRSPQNTGSSHHPGYRGIIFPPGHGGDDDAEPDQNFSHRASERNLRHSPNAAPSQESQEANDVFLSNLRSSDTGRAKPNRRPAWNSDFANDDSQYPSEPVNRGEDHGPVRTSGPMSTRQRLQQMRDELSAPEHDRQSAKEYAGIVPDREEVNQSNPGHPSSRGPQRSYDPPADVAPSSTRGFGGDSNTGGTGGGLGDILQPRKALSRTGLKPAVRPKPRQQPSSNYSGPSDSHPRSSNTQYDNPHDDVPVGGARHSQSSAQYDNPHDDVPVGDRGVGTGNDRDSYRSMPSTYDPSPSRSRHSHRDDPRHHGGPRNRGDSYHYDNSRHQDDSHYHDDSRYYEEAAPPDWREPPVASRQFEHSPPLPDHRHSARAHGYDSHEYPHDSRGSSSRYNHESARSDRDAYSAHASRGHPSHSDPYHDRYDQPQSSSSSSNINQATGRVRTAPPSHARNAPGSSGHPSGAQLSLLKSKLREHSAATAAAAQDSQGRRLTRQPSFGNLARGTSAGAYRDSRSARVTGGSGHTNRNVHSNRPHTGGPYSGGGSYYHDDPYIEDSTSNTPPFRHSSASYASQRPGMPSQGSQPGSLNDPRVRSAGSTGYSSYSDIRRPKSTSESYSATTNTAGVHRNKSNAYQYNIDDGYGDSDRWNNRRDQDHGRDRGPGYGPSYGHNDRGYDQDQDYDRDHHQNDGGDDHGEDEPRPRDTRMSYYTADTDKIPDSVAKQWENAYPDGHRPPSPLPEEDNIWRRKNPPPSSRGPRFVNRANRGASASRMQPTHRDESNDMDDGYHNDPVTSRGPPQRSTASSFSRGQPGSRTSRSQADPVDAFVAPDGQSVEIERIPCPQCGRKFAPKALESHSRACSKVFVSKRKKFDTKAKIIPAEAKALAEKKAREEGSQGRFGNDRPIAGRKGKKSSWQQKSNQLRAAMRAARDIKVAQERGEDISKLPPPPPTVDPSLIPCPHCGRRFNEQAAERHIPRCQNIKAKPTALRRGTGVAAGAIGAKRMAAATNRATSSSGRRPSASATSHSSSAFGRNDSAERNTFASGILPVPGMPGHSDTRSQPSARARAGSRGFSANHNRQPTQTRPSNFEDMPVRGAVQGRKYGGGYGQSHSSRSSAADYERMIEQEYERGYRYGAGGYSGR